MKTTGYSTFRKTYCPFSNAGIKPSLEMLGFVESSLVKSDLVVCRNIRIARLASVLFPRKVILVWTHEPRYDSTSEKLKRGLWGQRILVFNVFTGNVFFHNSHFFGSYHYDQSTDLGISMEPIEKVETLIDEAAFQKRKCLFGAFTKKDPSHFGFRVGNIGNVDGNFTRQSLIEDAIRLGIGEVAGRGWGVLQLEDSGYDGSNRTQWWIRKMELMANYNFSISIENTIYPYYVTEKIWQAIRAISLPVYVGKGSSIYDTFPRGSFIDVSDFPDNFDLLRYIKTMNYQTWCQRMNSCIATYNKEIERMHSRKDKLEEVIQKIRDAL